MAASYDPTYWGEPSPGTVQSWDEFVEYDAWEEEREAEWAAHREEAVN
jgi:hypothetical protein